jgi:nitroreductase
MEDFFELIEKRESCRNFDDKPVEKAKLVACINAARIAPSACDSQPWSFVVVSSSELLPRLAECLQGAGMNKFTSKCPSFIVVVEERATLSAKVAGIVKSQTYAQIDIGLSTMQLCLAATEQGLGTCIMGWFDEPKIKVLLDIPKAKRIRLVIGVGYAASDKHREKIRKNIDGIARFID